MALVRLITQPWKSLPAIKIHLMYLYGASGHGKVIIEILEKSGEKIDGIFDDNPNVTHLLDYLVESFPGSFDLLKDNLILSIGNNSIRKKISLQLKVNYGIAVHPFTSISTRSHLGQGTVVMAGVVINSDATIGDHCIINTNASIDHDCRLGNFVHVSPNAALCGNVEVGEGTHIGAGAVIIPGITIGKWCHIGAGTVVIRNIPDHSTAVGNPSKIIKTNLFI